MSNSAAILVTLAAINAALAAYRLRQAKNVMAAVHMALVVWLAIIAVVVWS